MHATRRWGSSFTLKLSMAALSIRLVPLLTSTPDKAGYDSGFRVGPNNINCGRCGSECPASCVQNGQARRSRLGQLRDHTRKVCGLQRNLDLLPKGLRKADKEASSRWSHLLRPPTMYVEKVLLEFPRVGNLTA